MRIEKRGPSKYEYNSPRPVNGYKPVSHSRQSRRRKNAPGCFALAAAVIIAAVVVIVLFKHFSYTNARMDLTEYLGISDGETAVFADNVQQTYESADAVRVDGEQVYLNLNFLNSCTHNRLYYNSDGTLRYMYPNEIICINEGDSGWTSGGQYTELGTQAFYTENGEVYVSEQLLEAFTDVSVDLYTEPNRVFITDLTADYQTACASKDTEIRYRGGPKSEILTDVPAGAELRVLSTVDNWTQVSYGGVVGYVESKNLSDIQKVVSDNESVVPEYSNISYDGKILFMWQQVYSTAANDDISDIISSAPGMNVICPTWYSVSDSAGGFTSYSDASYVETAHNAGVKVWAVVDDINAGITQEDLTSVLSNSSARAALISGLIADAQSVGVDGFNLDFESVDLAGIQNEFTAFMREMSVACRNAGLVMSVDNYEVSGGRTHDLYEENLIADYIVMMSYDEYWGTSSGAGPTASLGWFVSGVADTVDAGVDSSKIINGLALYTRIWSEGENGVEFTSSNMPDAAAAITAGGGTANWDSTNSLWYGEYTADGTDYKVWYEDVQSITAKMDGIASYDIAGVGIWSSKWWMQWNDSEVWSVIRNGLGM